MIELDKALVIIVHWGLMTSNAVAAMTIESWMNNVLFTAELS